MGAHLPPIRSLGDIFEPWNITKSATGCWEWNRTLNTAGYPRAVFDGKTVSVTRLIFKLKGIDIPAGKLACHKCDNPKCINPEHLFLGSPKENTLDAIQKGRFFGWSCVDPKEAAPLGKSGVRGIIWRKGRCKWSVVRYINGKQKSLGDFASLEAASQINSSIMP